MCSKFDKANPFRNSKTSQLNPSYLYDIDLFSQTKNWMKLESKHNHSDANKPKLLD